MSLLGVLFWFFFSFFSHQTADIERAFLQDICTIIRIGWNIHKGLLGSSALSAWYHNDSVVSVNSGTVDFIKKDWDICTQFVSC